MKKNYFELISGGYNIWESKLLRKMRIVTLLLLISITQTFALESYAQTKRLSINSKDETIINILNKIENQSEFYFMFDATIINVNQRKSINCENKQITAILDQLLEDTEIVYEISDRQIVLTRVQKTEAEQQISISGSVSDQSGSPLPGVTVVVKGTTQGTITDADGNYSLNNVPSDGTLIFSFVGMTTQEIPVGGKTNINVVMAEETIGLEEVVAVGYGVQKKVNMTGSVVTIGAEELAKRPVANAAQMLQGKLAGVEVSQYSGEPGSEGIKIRIRGMNSFGTNTDPIVLVDGFEGSLSNLDPNNIESISVLKDASSAAIYGSRAANGVILVTTKRGKEGEFSITYHGNFAVHQATKIPDFINDPVEFMEMFNVASINSGAGMTYPQDIINKYRSGEYKGFNWDDVFWKKPFVHNHNITATGGTKKVSYNFGLNYWDEEGVMIGFNSKQYKGLFNFDAEINEYISIGGGFNFSQINKKTTPDGSSNTWLSYNASLPTYGPKLDDGRYVFCMFPFEASYRNANPVSWAERGGQWTTTYNLLNRAYIKVTPIEGLSWETHGGVKYNHSSWKKQFPYAPTYYASTGEVAFPQGPATDELTVNQNYDVLYSLFSTINYSKSVGDHNFNVLAGYSQENFKYQYLQGFRRDFPNSTIMELNAGGSDGQSTGGSANEWALQSYFGRISYNLKEKYLFEANVRIDGSSRFHPDNRYGSFPSFSAGWRISEEDFAKNIDWLSNLKVRASWGKLGNQAIGNYPYQSLLNTGYSYSFDNSALTPGILQTSFSNQSITWETTKVIDIGFDLDMKDGLFSLTFDYFNKITSDILRGGQVMDFVGLGGPTINDGEMKNTGFDFTVGHRNNVGELKYSVDVNLSHYKNELVKFGEREVGSTTIREEGLPYNSWYLMEFDGIFQSQADINGSPVHFYDPRPGTIKLKDQDGDNTVDQDDRVVIDGKFPKFMYGFNLNLEWKNFDLSTFFQGVQGIKYFTQYWGIEPFCQGGKPTTKWRDAWTEENHSNTLPLLYFGFSETANRQPSTFWLQDGSYLRLKNLQVGYNIPQQIVNKIAAAEARIYFSGDNLFTISNFEGADPERDPGQSRYGVYPQLKIYSLGIKVKF